MGVTLDLRLIDHERIAVRGLQVVNDAICHQDPDRLRSYIAGLPVEVDPDTVEFRMTRLSKLRELQAPEIIIRNEENFLRLANGEAYLPKEYEKSALDELRHLLGTWCWLGHTYNLDKSWDELHWYLEPMAGPDVSPLSPLRAGVGDPDQTVFTKAFQGTVLYPEDDLGAPVIRTLGSQEAGCFAYNPPEICKVILDALKRVESADWDERVPFRFKLYGRCGWNLNEEDIAVLVEEELWRARETFPILLSVYAKAAEKGYGVSCEYSL